MKLLIQKRQKRGRELQSLGPMDRQDLDAVLRDFRGCLPFMPFVIGEGLEALREIEE